MPLTTPVSSYLPPVPFTSLTPEGVEIVKIEKATNLLSGNPFPDGCYPAFLAGAAPIGASELSTSFLAALP